MLRKYFFSNGFLSLKNGGNYIIVPPLLFICIWRKYSFWDSFLTQEIFKNVKISKYFLTLKKLSENQEIYKKLSQKLAFWHLVYSKKNVLEIYFSASSFASENISKFPLSESFLSQETISKAAFSSDIWQQQWRDNYAISTIFLTLKTIGKQTIFLTFFISRNFFKKYDSCQFLVSEYHNKIWHSLNIFCNYCVLEIFDVSSVISQFDLIPFYCCSVLYI